MLSRRRLLSISAATLASAALPARGHGLTQWRGVALGADASITLAHPQAENIIARARAEIERLEGVFSLHQPGSALVRLNAAGDLRDPPFELLECLGQCARLHAATGGAFDPTVQPLWGLYARHYADGTHSGPPDSTARAEALARTGWQRVRYDPGAIRLAPGMALTLNGIAQGYIADRVASLLRGMGLDHVLVNTGEFVALGDDPRGGPWQIGIRDGDGLLPGQVALQGGALATSAPHGISFDTAGQAGHILDPLTGHSAPARWKLVTVTAPQAWLADGLSTASCLMTRDRIDAALAAFPQSALAAIVPGTAL